MHPQEIIKAFDECLEMIWGHAYGRDNPHASDKATAQRWLDDGITLTSATAVFYQQMTWMHEKWLRLGDNKSRDNIPRALRIFDENIASMILRLTHPVDAWEAETSRWRSRVRGWSRNPGLWNDEHWGPLPNEQGCRAPRAVLNEVLKAPAGSKRRVQIDDVIEEKKTAERGLATSSAVSIRGSL